MSEQGWVIRHKEDGDYCWAFIEDVFVDGNTLSYWSDDWKSDPKEVYTFSTYKEAQDVINRTVKSWNIQNDNSETMAADDFEIVAYDEAKALYEMENL